MTSAGYCAGPANLTGLTEELGPSATGTVIGTWGARAGSAFVYVTLLDSEPELPNMGGSAGASRCTGSPGDMAPFATGCISARAS